MQSVKILGVNLPGSKTVWCSLTYIYGIGRTLAFKICESASIDPYGRMNKLTQEELESVKNIIESNYKVEGDLRLDVQGNIKFLMAIRCFRGSRHKKGLPCRGQRSKTNARTRKGKRKTVSSLHKK